ncbi:MAG: hypothetical protein AAF328_06350 [Planctomycetota bacterium]
MNKDLGFFAKHTEKLVLGAAVVLLLAVVAYAWLGVLGQPHATDNGDGPGQLEDKITSAAERVTTGIRSDRTNLPTTEEYIVPDYAQEFGVGSPSRSRRSLNSTRPSRAPASGSTSEATPSRISIACSYPRHPWRRRSISNPSTASWPTPGP